MNTSIHILEALTGLYQVWPDPLVKTRVQEMLEVCRDKVYSEPGYLIQFLSADWKPTRSPDSFGHDVEAGYLMVEAAEVLGQDDPRAWTAARHLVDHAMQYGWDNQHGGLYDSGAMNAEGAVTGNLRTEKVWWVEAEHLNALLLQHEHVGKETTQVLGRLRQGMGLDHEVPDRPYQRRLVGHGRGRRHSRQQGQGRHVDGMLPPGPCDAQRVGAAQKTGGGGKVRPPPTLCRWSYD